MSHLSHGIDTHTAGGLRPKAGRKPLFRGALLAILVYLVMYVLYGLAEPDAFSAYSIANLFNNAAPLALAAAGQTLVILSRGFDLSLAGVISIANVLTAIAPFDGPLGALFSLALSMAAGAVVGAVNGYLVAYRGIQTIAATLGTMIISQGIALLLLPVPGGSVAPFVSDTLTDMLWNTVPVSALIVGFFALLWLGLKNTDTGIAFYAVGADDNAAALSGIPVKWTRCKAFILAGCFYGAAGFMLSAQTATGDPNAGLPFLLLSFAAVALGGTSLSGGHGGAFGSMVGAAVLLLMQKMLFALGVASFYIGFFQGVLLILAIVCGRVINRPRAGGTAR
ncbi:ABC transporter permease [Sodalis ligni]|uniref:ABC transporter permease n=1 Tax=Sodalis TaxID=84565 RepID=UPI00193FC3AE|nr:ABC transporter permease [Sodalis ligni]QWA12737.1 ABC transporter permease [Sodalis ligni]